MQSIGIIGAGAWGTALAQALARAGRDVVLWAREAEVVASVNAQHENTVYLPGIALDATLRATGDINEAAAKNILLLVPPTQYLRDILKLLQPDVQHKPLVLCCKGVEIGTGLLPSQIVQQILPKAPLAVLTGPSFAAEAARGLPLALTLAAADRALAAKLQQNLATPQLRPYIADDMTGAQIGAALKNVLAIACGIAHGKKLGENARAAIVTRGLAEMGRLCIALGGERETLMGLCGIGDLTLTCSSMQSRNFSLGAAMGEGRSADDILGPRKAVTEGVYTAAAAAELAKKHRVDLPIIETVNQCLNHGLPVDAAMQALLNRPVTEE